MSRHVTKETATVYRCHANGRRYFSRWAAYYNSAKTMLFEKYPHTTFDELEPGPQTICYSYQDSTSPEDGPSGHYWDTDKYQAFVRRLAKFLRFVDGKEPAP